MTEKEIEIIVKKIKTFLTKEDLINDTSIYYNNKRENLATGKIEENMNVKDYLEYCNPDTFSLIFEGSLYQAINTGNGRIERKLNKIVEPYGLYWESGYAWSMSAYK